MSAASRPGRRWRQFSPSWRPAAASRFRSVATWPLFCRVLPTSPSSASLTLPPRRGLPDNSTSLFALCRHLPPSCRLPWLPVTNSGSPFTPLLQHQIHSRNRWFPLTLTIQRRAIIPPVVLEPPSDLRVEHPGQILDSLVAAQMQVPASNLFPNRFHRLVGNCRAEVDEVLPKPILRSPRPKRVAQEFEFFVRIRPSPILTLAIDNFRLLRMKFQPTLLQARGYGSPNSLGFRLRPAMHDG